MVSERELNSITLEGKTLANSGEDFRLGYFEKAKLNDKDEIVLDAENLRGSYISPKIDCSKFNSLVSSWNAMTPKGTTIEVFLKVIVDGKWSSWFSYGKWSTNGEGGSIKNQKYEIAHMDIDTLIILNGKEGNGFKYKVDVSRDDISNESPKIKAIYTTLRISEEITRDDLDKYHDWTGDLDVPKRSQMVVPEIGNIICSPTSISMVMEYYGKKIDTEIVAEGVLDKGANIYGNWSYNVAYAGTVGFTAYVDRFTSVNEIKEKLSKGIPIVASIRTKDKGELENSPMAYPGGHLLVVRGFKIKDKDEYVIVNDPAAPNHDTVSREYKLSEFEKAWGGVVYILRLESR